MGAAAAATALPLMVGSTISSAYGAYESGKASSEAANYQAQVARNNQIIANQNSAYALQRGNVMVQQKQLQTAQAEGNVRAALGASGVDTNAGTSVRVQSDVAKLGAYDALSIRNAAAREAYGYQTQGMSYGAQAGLESAQAEQALLSGYLNAGSSLIGGASNVSAKWGSIFGDSGGGGGAGAFGSSGIPWAP